MKKLVCAVLNWLDPYKVDVRQKECSVDCPKGGICPVKHCASFQGNIWVEDLFECAKVQKQIIEMKSIIK